MFIGTRGAMLRGATPLALETKDDAIGIPEVKTAVDALGKTFETFKAKNDELIAQLQKKGEDAVTKDEVEKLNKGIDDFKAELKKRLDELEAKRNRELLAGGGEGAAETKAARAFGELIGQKDYNAEKLAEYKGDLAHFLRRNEAKATTMQVASDPSGGFWVTPDVSGRMIKKIYESTPMRQVASVVSIGTDRLEGPIDNGEFGAAWVGELQQRNQTDTSQIGMWSIDVHELYALPKVTQKLLEDAKIDIEAWIADKATTHFSRKENAAFLNGSGVQQPKGLMSYPTAATADATRAWGTFQYVPSGGASGFASSNPADAVIDLIYEVKGGYRQNARFLGARRTFGACRKLKDGQGNYLVDLRLRDGALVESIFGYPTIDGEDMPAIGANALPLAFGDFAEAYTIVDRLGTSVKRDDISQLGFIRYLMRRRVGGGAVNFEAVKFLKMATS